jgi:hypothetical protein
MRFASLALAAPLSGVRILEVFFKSLVQFVELLLGNSLGRIHSVVQLAP